MPYYPIKTQEDLDYYLSHISIICKEFLEEKFNQYSWKFDSFNNQSTSIQEIYFLTFSALDYDRFENVYITLRIKKCDKNYIIESSNLLFSEK